MFALAVIGCNVDGLDFENLEGPSLSPTAALPIGSVSYTIRELIDEINDENLDLQEDSTSLLFMVYRDTAEFSNGTDIINIDDVSHTANVDLFPTIAVGNAIVVPLDTTFTFSYDADNGEPVDSVFYESGTITLDVNTNISSDFNYTVTVLNTVSTSTGDAVEFTGTQDTESGSLSLEGYKTSLNLVDGQNTFEVEFSFNVILLAGERINAGDFVSLTITYQDQAFSILYGKFGQDRLEVGNEILDIKLFSQLGNSGLEFGNPVLSFEFENGFGLPLGLFLDGLYGVKDGDTTFLSGDITESATGERIEGAFTPSNPENTLIELNKSNSTIANLLNSSPEQMGFNLAALTNPTDANFSNFVESTSQIRTFIEMTLPMQVRLSDLSRKVSFNLGNGLDFNEADSVTIRVVTVNEIPLFVTMDLEIVDENDSVLYTVANNEIISTPFLNIDGSLKEARKTIEDIPLSPEGIDALNVGKKVVLRTLLNSPKSRTGNDIFVKILADYQLDLQVSVVGTLKVDL